jgi:3-oxoacyl-[acyl-carrier protein] reductase
MIRNRGGNIINFSTIAVALGLKGEAIYAASKAGVEGFSRTFAREMSDFNINVNCIAPGPIDTDLIKGVSKLQIENIVKQQIYQKQFLSSDICDVVEVLMDARSKALTGQVFHVGGV